MSPQKNAVERKRGNRLGFLFFQLAVRIFGLRGAYGFLYFIALYYLLIDRPVVSATRAYVRRRFPDYGTGRQLLSVYRLFVSQGKNLIDRYALSLGCGGIEIEFLGQDKISSMLSRQGKGFILLTAHVGNWQVTMTALKKFERTVYLMMRPEDNEAVRNALHIDNERELVKIIFTDNALGRVVEAIQAIQQGSLVSIMGDRTYGYGAVDAPFLGERVQFPYGAFSIAAAAECPVVVLLSAKTGPKKYIVDVSHVILPPAGRGEAKKNAIKAAVREFSGVLEEYVRQYPYQWFVFRDIWKSNI